jgi:hypothetical protein
MYGRIALVVKPNIWQTTENYRLKASIIDFCGNQRPAYMSITHHVATNNSAAL